MKFKCTKTSSIRKNHRIEDNCVVRDVVEEVWFIELDTLVDLLMFSTKYRDITLSVGEDSSSKIEIYGEYRE